MTDTPDKSKGYVKIYRKIQDGDLWNDGKPYSKFKAWVWLLLNARGVPYKFNSSLTIKRGEILTSTSKLAEIWGWSKKTVWLFLDKLRKEKRINSKRIGKQVGTLISILNYDDFNPQVNSEVNSKLPENYLKITQKLPEKETQDNKDKERKNLNNISMLFEILNKSDILKIISQTPQSDIWMMKMIKSYPNLDFQKVVDKYEGELLAEYAGKKMCTANTMMKNLGRWFDNEGNFNNGSFTPKNAKHGDTKPTKDGDDRFKSLHYWNPLNLESDGKWITYRTWQYNCENKTDGIGYWQQNGTKQTEPSNYEK